MSPTALTPTMLSVLVLAGPSLLGLLGPEESSSAAALHVLPNEPSVAQDESVPAAEVRDDEGQKLWQRMLAASRPTGSANAPIEAFYLRANVLTRQGVQSNEGYVDFSYLHPDLVRFALPDGKEVGRSGTKQRDYWMKSADDVISLSGREYTEDRRQIQEMHAIARNFLALADPARVSIENAERLEVPPSDLAGSLGREAKRLRWLRVRSRDFALSGGDEDTGDAAFIVDFGLVRAGDDADLPKFCVVRPAPNSSSLGVPMLVRLDAYLSLDGFRVPAELKVFSLDFSTRPWRFQEKAGQEIYLVAPSTLRAELSVDDFRPGA